MFRGDIDGRGEPQVGQRAGVARELGRATAAGDGLDSCPGQIRNGFRAGSVGAIDHLRLQHRVTRTKPSPGCGIRGHG